jgi:putative ABC transport system permease protein
MSSNKLRSNLTIAIIAIGITALIAIITVIEILKSSIYTNFSSMGANTFNITAQTIHSDKKKPGKRRRLSTSDQSNTISLKEASFFKDNFSYPSIVSLNVLVNNAATIKRNKKKSNPTIFVLGADENYMKVSGNTMQHGRYFSTMDIASGENNCVIGYSLAKKYFEDPEDAANGLLYIGDARYRVLGVMESKGSSFVDRTDNMVIIPLTNARQRFNLTQKSFVISVFVNNINTIDIATDEAEGFMRKTKRLQASTENNFTINKNDEIASSLIDLSKYVALAAAVIGLITLLGAAIGLMNIMLVSVAERTREIGLSKAIGANSRTIQLQFLVEAVIISVSGGAIGVLVGILIGNSMSLFLHTAFVIPWLWIAVGLSICFFVGLLAGIYPAIKAGKLNPINALRYE